MRACYLHSMQDCAAATNQGKQRALCFAGVACCGPRRGFCHPLTLRLRQRVVSVAGRAWMSSAPSFEPLLMLMTRALSALDV